MSIFYYLCAKNNKVMDTIIGRKKEQRLLEEYYRSDKAEFVVVCGRRRVGKTFLIREHYHDKFAFYLSGAENATKAVQLKNFNVAINTYSGYPYPAVTDWQDAFLQLQHYIENRATKEKIVLFLMNFPGWTTKNPVFYPHLNIFGTPLLRQNGIFCLLPAVRLLRGLSTR